MRPTPQQQRVFDALTGSADNLLIEAVAGSGKTTTLQTCLRYVPATTSVLFCAFNRHVAEELRGRLPSHVRVSTMHGVGWGLIREAWPQVGIKERRVAEALWRACGRDREAFRRVAAAGVRVVSLLKGEDRRTPCGPRDCLEVAARYDVRPAPDWDPVVRVWNALLEEGSRGADAAPTAVDFDDMCWLPCARGLLREPRYDLVLVDEAQDLNACQINLACSLGRRVVAVGDRNQSIYGFRGACPDAMDQLQRRLRAVPLPLSVCFRCGPSIVATAQGYVPHIMPPPPSEEERVDPAVVRSTTYPEMLRMLGAGDYVLCRFTVPLAVLGAELMAYRQDVPVRMTGVDLRGEVEVALRPAPPPSEEPPPQGMPSVQERPRLGSILRAKVEEPVLERLRGGLRDAAPAGAAPLTLSSIHRAKGLEARRVFVLGAGEVQDAGAGWQAAQEHNLKYVAITRAKRQLWFVEPKEPPPQRLATVVLEGR